MKKKNKKLISIIVVNYNNYKYLKDSINSLKKQTYDNLEIIVIDDQSTDESLEILKKIKDISLIITKNKTKFGSYNQMNAYYKGIQKAKGEIIFFLDSDDIFKKKKIQFITSYFLKNKEVKVIFDKPYLFENKNKKKKLSIKKRNKFLIPWEKFPPQSCIAIKKNYFKKIYKKIKIRKFPNIWLDFRIAAQSKIDFGDLKILDKYLTYYRQTPNSESQKFKKFSKNWWIRRKEAHLFLAYIFKVNKKKLNFSFDKYLTQGINLFTQI